MNITDPIFHDEAKAFEYLESVLWADGIVCPHCGVVGEATSVGGMTVSSSADMNL